MWQKKALTVIWTRGAGVDSPGWQQMERRCWGAKPPDCDWVRAGNGKKEEG